jgi:hypothetical protein
MNGVSRMGVGDRRKNERRSGQAGAGITERRSTNDRRHKDRRESPRVPLELWMEEVSGEDVYFRRTGNVGEGGVYFDRAIPHSLGTMVTLKFSLPGDKEMVIARGEVVSAAGSEQGLGMGVKFLNVEGDGQKRLREYIVKRLH